MLTGLHPILSGALQDVRYLSRQDSYDVAASAYLIVRTGETRTYGNAILRKGVVSSAEGGI